MTDTKGTDVTGLAPQIHRGEAMSERVHREPRGTECANCMATNTKSVGFAAPGTYVPSGEVIRLCPECTGALRGGAFAVLSERFSREPSHVE
ncbi:MAG: hypothetical protein JWO67_4565 [Streptosporangiaceae bacterium]|nr:hypothetical protein [Streptosporangiaceae bacterium]